MFLIDCNGYTYQNMELENICEFLDFFIQKFDLQPLSVRTRNILLNEQIDNLSDFLSMDVSYILKIQNCGRKSCYEILSLQRAIEHFFENSSFEDINIFMNEIKQKKTPQKQKISSKYKTLDLNLVNFSNRLHNVLINNNINSIEDILSYTEKELFNLPLMGKKSFIELKDFLNSRNIKIGIDYEWDNSISSESQNLQTFLTELRNCKETLTEEKLKIIYKSRLETKNILPLSDLGNNLNLTKERVRQIEKKLLALFSRTLLYNKEVYDNIFNNYGAIISLEDSGPLDIYGNFKWTIINTLAHEIDNDWHVDYERMLLLKNININKLLININWIKQDYTLNEITAEIDTLLKEYVNSYEIKNFNLIKKQLIREVLIRQFISIDGYKYILNTETVMDNTEDDTTKKKYFSASKINRSQEHGNLHKIKKRDVKRAILLRFAASFCQQARNIDEIYEEYHNYLRTQGHLLFQEYSCDYNTLYNKMKKDENFLCSPGKMFRFVDFTEYDTQQIINRLHLEQYNDVDISTLAIFRQHIDLMEEYNIKDEYELHSFIKKFYISDNIDISRTPIIKFGNADRKKQVLDVLYSISPASQKDLAIAYEEKYGIKEPIFISNYLHLVSDYNENGKYSCYIKKFDDIDFERIKKILTADFYTLKDVKGVLSPYYKEDLDGFINNYNMNKLGYNLLSSFIYKNKFSSVTNLANSIIDSSNILDISVFSGLFNSGAAYSVLQERKLAFDIIEFQHNKFINIKLLKQKNIEKADIINFINKVEDYVDNKFFTIHSIYNGGFSYPKLDICGFDEFFYVNILYFSKEFNIRKINGTFLLRRVSEPIDSIDFLVIILQKLRKINIYELIDYIYENYKLTIDKYFIISACNLSEELYYSDTMEKVYINYDEYLNDL